MLLGAACEPARSPASRPGSAAGDAAAGSSGPAAGPEKSADPAAAAVETPGGESAAPSRGLIGLSVLTMTNPFFKVIADTMTSEARKHGYETLVVSGEDDVVRQQNQVKDFIVKGVAAIVLTPCDSKAIGPAIQEANRHGIPVFTADIACLAPGVEVVSHVATDNLQGGKEAARAMIDVLGGKGKVAIIDYPEVESVILRTRGFEEVISRENERPDIDIQIVAKLPGGGQKDKSYKAAEDIIQAHPDLAGIFAINDPTALGARAALEKAGKAGQVAIIGFDGQPEGKLAILEGKIHADPIQFPERIAARTVEVIVKHFNGEEVPKEILIPTELYTREDAVKDPALK
ncbi:MAG: substrate-binding domain-containing protein [Planctomycetes bacterium]|nr:substrate-binding domain-containing protein [Planctomycetota bacterium]